MLAANRLNGFFLTKEPGRAREFYEGVLGLTFESENEHVIVFRSHESRIIGHKVEAFTPVPSTILGWEVQDIAKFVTLLADRGVVFQRYDFLEQDKLGIWKSPDGKVAWFKDPDGNVLSLGEENV